MAAPAHIPVLLEEVSQALAIQPGGRYIDGTVGSGGHAAAILDQSSPGGQLLGIDADPEAIKATQERLKAYQNSILLINDNFANLQNICLKYDFSPVHGILFDLGLSSIQLNSNGRGFSFQHDAALDMRLSPSQKVTAADIINTYSETDLANIIKMYGEEANSHQIARRIAQERPIRTTGHLARVIEHAVGGRRGRLHPATKTFQALRIAVNHELENLESALKQALSRLGLGGRLVVISYHSLEDRIVKQFMQRESRDCVCPPKAPTCRCGHKASLKLINKKVIIPSRDEVEANPRSRSARLRAAERITISDDPDQLAEILSNSAGNEARGWRKPFLVEKIRKAFLAAQYNSPGYARAGRLKM